MILSSPGVGTASGTAVVLEDLGIRVRVLRQGYHCDLNCEGGRSPRDVHDGRSRRLYVHPEADVGGRIQTHVVVPRSSEIEKQATRGAAVSEVMSNVRGGVGVHTGQGAIQLRRVEGVWMWCARRSNIEGVEVLIFAAPRTT
jgi:hypothetical protein